MHGKEAAALNGFYMMEEDSSHVDPLPIPEALHYCVPFSPGRGARHIGSLAGREEQEGQPAAVYFDGIEKFGIWPETYQWVYERGWLRQVLKGVLNSKVIKPMRYADYHKQARTNGVLYLPTTSYIEMNEWTLPLPAEHHYADLLPQEGEHQRYDIAKAFVRGGIWRNSIMRYP